MDFLIKEFLSIFDIWSVQHFSFWVFIWAYVAIYNKKHIKKIVKVMTENNPLQIIETDLKNIFFFDIILLLLIAYFWETTEHYIEIWYFWELLRSFTQYESYSNRVLWDPFVLILWYFLSIRFKYIKYLALVFVTSFFFYHILVAKITH